MVAGAALRTRHAFFLFSFCHSILNDIYTETFAMFIACIVFFSLHEPPRYLVQAGHPQDALESLQMISRFNGSELYLSLNDVEDHIHVPPTHARNLAIPGNGGLPSSRLFDADVEFSSSPTEIKPLSTTACTGTPLSSSPPDSAEGAIPIKDYSATGGSEVLLTAYAVSASKHRSYPYQVTPSPGGNSFNDVPLLSKEEEDSEDDVDVPPARLHPPFLCTSSGDKCPSISHLLSTS